MGVLVLNSGLLLEAVAREGFTRTNAERLLALWWIDRVNAHLHLFIGARLAAAGLKVSPLLMPTARQRRVEASMVQFYGPALGPWHCSLARRHINGVSGVWGIRDDGPVRFAALAARPECAGCR